MNLSGRGSQLSTAQAPSPFPSARQEACRRSAAARPARRVDGGGADGIPSRAATSATGMLGSASHSPKGHRNRAGRLRWLPLASLPKRRSAQGFAAQVRKGNATFPAYAAVMTRGFPWYGIRDDRRRSTCSRWATYRTRACGTTRPRAGAPSCARLLAPGAVRNLPNRLVRGWHPLQSTDHDEGMALNDAQAKIPTSSISNHGIRRACLRCAGAAVGQRSSILPFAASPWLSDCRLDRRGRDIGFGM